MKIRRATKKDFGEIAILIKVEYLKHYNEKWTEKNAIKTLEHYRNIGKIFVAETDRQVIGFIIFGEEYYNDGKSLKVEELVVSRHSQGKGIGRELMNFVEKYCKKNDIKFIWLITGKKVPAFKFYKKIGYKYKKDTAYFSKELK
jgi:ribosomal protein S18 acetylase RimI-like enzyme